MNINAMCHGPVKHELTVSQLDRIKKIWDKIKDFSNNLETFELDFMRDANPDKEIKIWENIVETIDICTKQIKTEWSEVSVVEKKYFYEEILKITVGCYTEEEILNSNDLSFMAFTYWKVKNKQ